MIRRLPLLLLAGSCLLLASCRACERCLAPRAITGEVRADPELVTLTSEAPVERGRPRKVIDGIGWVFGIPSKIVLWDRRVENHAVGPETEAAIREYLDDEGLDHAIRATPQSRFRVVEDGDAIAGLEARGATGIIFGTSGYDVEREMRAYAEVAGLR